MATGTMSGRATAASLQPRLRGHFSRHHLGFMRAVPNHFETRPSSTPGGCREADPVIVRQLPPSASPLDLQDGAEGMGGQKAIEVFSPSRMSSS